MTTQTKASDSLPLTEAGKPENKQSDLPPARAAQPKGEAAKSKKPKESLPLKASPVNPAWAEEVAGAFGISGQIAKQVANELEEAVTKQVMSKFTRPKLAKLVRAAVARTIQ